MSITIRPLDTDSTADVEQHSAVEEANDQQLYGGAEHYTPEQKRVRLAGTAFWDQHHLVATDGGTILGFLSASVPLSENLDQVFADLVVHPDHRRQGVATALIDEGLRPLMRKIGRPTLSMFGSIPRDGDPDDPGFAANRVAARLGIGRKNVAVCRVLDLPLPDGLLDGLSDQVSEKIGDYRILPFDDEIPEEHLAAYGALMRQLDLDDPDEDFEHEPADYTPERIRTAEKRLRDAGKRSMIAVAVAPDGSFAGNSVVEFHAGERTTVGWQENTLVMPDHRGHRLGLALKVATHRRLAQEAPGLRGIATWNSHVNPWMIAVNEQLGYRIAHREVVYQGPFVA